ncbi:MAG: hypothetical protein A2Y88_10810 [Chloroflexi bacterium RBG_13_48_10]|nr:MAG: hypothetical protein A2Y88_10810 [Chloroflexi bacterium RBG_13_48_10]
MKQIKIINQTQPRSEPIVAKYCQSFLCQLRGLMFSSSLPKNSGLLLVQGSDSRVNASIHMMFMQMDLAVIWIDSAYEVADLVLARRWKLAYLPKRAAKFVLETGVSNLSDFKIGDKVRFEEI